MREPETVREAATVEEIAVAVVVVDVLEAEVAGADGAVVLAAVVADDMAATVGVAEAGTRFRWQTSPSICRTENPRAAQLCGPFYLTT